MLRRVLHARQFLEQLGGRRRRLRRLRKAVPQQQRQKFVDPIHVREVLRGVARQCRHESRFVELVVGEERRADRLAAQVGDGLLDRLHGADMVGGLHPAQEFLEANAHRPYRLELGAAHQHVLGNPAACAAGMEEVAGINAGLIGPGKDLLGVGKSANPTIGEVAVDEGGLGADALVVEAVDQRQHQMTERVAHFVVAEDGAAEDHAICQIADRGVLRVAVPQAEINDTGADQHAQLRPQLISGFGDERHEMDGKPQALVLQLWLIEQRHRRTAADQPLDAQMIVDQHRRRELGGQADAQHARRGEAGCKSPVKARLVGVELDATLVNLGALEIVARERQRLLEKCLGGLIVARQMLAFGALEQEFEREPLGGFCRQQLHACRSELAGLQIGRRKSRATRRGEIEFREGETLLAVLHHFAGEVEVLQDIE